MTITPATLKALADGDLANALVASTPGGIEAQEAAGQRDMVASFTTLPKEMSGEKYNDFEAGRKIAEAFGFIYGDDVDELFVSVTAPMGWQLKATGHSMHSNILDETGVERGSIFYKAAFYDRRAHGHWNTRFYFDRVWPKQEEYDTYTYHLRDRRNPTLSLWSEDIAKQDGEEYRDWSKRENEMFDRAAKIADEKFPNRRDPTAYWHE